MKTKKCIKQKNKTVNKGFTLIELLVVVLIIGILAGIALPQYRRAKEKAEASELQIMVKTLHEAQQRYYLVNGVFSESFDNLDVDFSGYQRENNNLCQRDIPNSDCIVDGEKALILATYGGKSSRALYTEGRYNYSGFMIVEEGKEALSSLPTNQLICYEYAKKGFCSKLLNCNLIYTLDSMNHYYSCES